VITVVTPTIPGREHLLAECEASVVAAGFSHLVERDDRREGPAVVRNRLIARVRTPWVLCLDDDDLLHPAYWRVVQRNLAGADVVYTAWELQGADDPQPKPGPFDAELLQRQNFIPVTACVRTSALRAVGGFPTGVPLEDHELWKALAAAGYRFRFVPVVAWTYRRLAGSRTDQVAQQGGSGG
jgi:glycosyltransferase involved in cell wall biosynthesis